MFAKVSARSYLSAFLFAGYYNVVNVCEGVSMNLISKYGIHHSTKCWTGILEAFGYPQVTVCAEGCDKIHFFFIFFTQPDPMVAREAI
jgi:hypothetical protein